jgi:glycosyltransferase involved in cell wall biosynthesis
MTNHCTEINYIIVSPVKDEQSYIEDTIKSIIAQTVKPSAWVIVDDYSRDETVAIIERYCTVHQWITLIKTNREDKRQPGAAVINAFNKGYEIVKNNTYDFIVKLDCDLRIDPDYFERLMFKFNKNIKLGIASGIYLEKNNNNWNAIEMPPYHAAGACKVLRKTCFRQIGGFVPVRGWDTIDEIKAQCNGWETCHFDELRFYHLKPEGAGIGKIRTNIMHGEIYYLTGGSYLFLFFKIIHRMIFGRPLLIGGIMMLFGYVRSLILKKKRLVNDDEAFFYKKLLNQRILRQLKNLI